MLSLRMVLAIALLAASAAWTTAAEAQGAREAALVLRVLSYDRNVRRRVDGDIDVVILYVRGDRRSEATRRQMTRAVTTLGRRITVANRPIRARALAFTSATDLERQLRNAAAVYVCPGLERNASVISEATRTASVLSLTSDEASVRRGLGVGILQGGSQVRLLVNMRAIRAEGVRLDAALLRLATVIR